MRRKKVKAGLGSKDVLQKIELGRRLVKDCTGNPNFINPNPALADITAASDEAEVAFNNAKGGGKDETAILRERELALDIIITAFASYVDSVARGSDTIILSSGFDASKDPDPTGTPEQVTGLEASITQKKGEVELDFDPVRRVIAYIIEKSDTPDDAGFSQLAIVSSTRFLVTGLESLRNHWFRVRAVGRRGLLGPYSDPAQSIAL